MKTNLDKFILTVIAFASAFVSAAHAQNATWLPTTSGTWSKGSNWSTGSAPGSTSSTTNSNIAIFNNSNSVTTATITIDQSNQNIGSILFGSTDTYQYTFSGQPLLLSSGGLISQTELPQYTQTFNTSLVLEPASSTSNGTYTFGNASGAFGEFAFDAPISGGTTTGSITLNLGPDVFASTIQGAISNGGAAGGVGVVMNNSQWNFTGGNTYTGPTTLNYSTLNLSGSLSSSTSLTLNGGLLNFSRIGNQTINGLTLAGGTSTINNTGNSLILNKITRASDSMLNLTSSGGTTSTTTSNTNGILGPWAITGSTNLASYAYNNGSQIGFYFGATSATAGTLANMTSSTTNYTYSGGNITLGSDVKGYTLSAGGLTLDTSGHTLTLDGLLDTNANSMTISGTGALMTGPTGELDVMGIGFSTISSAINGSGALVYGGIGSFGRITLAGVNGYTGGTFLNSGIVLMSGSGTLGASTSNLTVAAATLDLEGTTQQVGQLNGTAKATIYNNAAATASTLTVGVGDATGGNYAGVITDHGSSGGTMALAKVGAGTQTLSGFNSYSGGTTVTAGTLYADGGGTAYAGNPSVALQTYSSTGTGSVTVKSGATLGGTGLIRPTQSGAGVVLNAHANLRSGDGTSGGGLTLDNTVAKGVILDASIGSANLTFDLRAGNINNPFPNDFASPNTNSTYLTVLGSTLGEIKFATGDTITINDSTGSNSLQLKAGTPYLLIAAGTNPGLSESNNDLYSGLITSGGLDGHGGYNNGWVENLTIKGTAVDQDLGTSLYLFNGELEIVPEPGTYVLLLGSLAMLFAYQNRCKKRSSSVR